MTGIIDVGGGMRDIYGAGVLDRCMDDGVQFDSCCGISAGSANIVSYMAGQRGRNLFFYSTYSFRKEYMSMGNLLRSGNYIGLDYIYSGLSNSDGEAPLDYDSILRYPGRLCVVATRAEDNTPVYFSKSDLAADRYDILKASCCIPVVCKPYIIDGVAYYDGGLSDPLPIDKMIAEGCDKVVVILTRPTDFVPKDRKNRVLPVLRRILPQYPQVAEGFFSRNEVYHQSLLRAQELQAQGRALIVAPDDCCGVNTLKKTKETLLALYTKGYRDGKAIRQFLAS